MPRGSETGGRPSTALAEAMRRDIVTGQYAVGQFLPPVRELCSRHGVARETARRALKRLERQGLVNAEARHGYRVLGRANDPDQGLPVGIVRFKGPSGGAFSGVYRRMVEGLQAEAGARGWSSLLVEGEGLSREAVLERLRAGRASGALVDSEDPPFLKSVIEMGLPAVMVDSSSGGLPLDAVTQDNFGGARLAADYLVGRGHERIGWVGPVTEPMPSVERWGGVAGALGHRGMSIPLEMIAGWDRGQDVRPAVRRLLERRDRPTGLVALWRDMAVPAAEVVAELGLVLGKDVEMVGWCSEEQFATEYAPHLPAGRVPATVTWSIAQLARTAVARLVERRAHPELPPIRLIVPTWLRAEVGK